MRRPPYAPRVMALALAVAAAWLAPAAPAAAAPTVAVRARTEVRLGAIRKEAEGRYVVSGQLVDRLAGTGLGGETVELSLGGARAVATTRADGTFEARLDVPGGPQDLDVRFDGSDLLDPAVVELADVDIDKMPLELQLTTTGVVDGVRVDVVATTTGDFAVELPVTLTIGALDAAADELKPLATVVTAPGRGSIVVTRALAQGPGRRRVRATFGGDSVYARATADVTVELAASTTITLAVAATEVAHEDDVVATGKVTDDDGRGVGRVPVALVVEGRRLAQTMTGADGGYRLRFEAGAVGTGRRALQAVVEPTEGWLRADRSDLVFIEVAAPQPVPIAYTIAAFVVTALCAVGFFAARTRPWQRLRRPSVDERRAADPAREPDGGLVPARSSLVSTLRRPGDHGFTGAVRDAIRHRPLAGARVTLRRGDAVAEAVADADGGFAVEGLAAGEWRAEAALPGHCTERFAVTIPHRGELRGARVDLMPVRERIFSIYKRAAVPALPDPALWGVWSPRQVFDHVRRGRPAPALSELTDYVEERYFSLRLPDEDELPAAEQRVGAALRERPPAPVAPPGR